MRYLWMMLTALSLSVLAETHTPDTAPGVNRASVETLLEVSEARKLLESTQQQLEQMLQTLLQQKHLSAAQRPVVEKFSHQLLDLIQAEISWEKLHEPMIDIYMKHYSQQEIDEILAFYRSETGQSLLKKQPQVVQETMQLSQQAAQNLLPKIKQLTDDMRRELQAQQADAKTPEANQP